VTATISARGREYSILPQSLWHWTPAQTHLLRNVHICEGVFLSTSAARAEGLNAVTMHGAFGNLKKEAEWERVRLAVNAQLPTRQHAFFAFDTEDAATHAKNKWYPDEDRLRIEARAAAGAKMHRADSLLLDCQPAQWAANAERYWRGEMTDDPLPEIVFEGFAYFPGWREPPFGLFAGMLPG
jgi:hypothetical protein